MKVVFLDIDGVLNNDKTNAKTPDGFTGIGNSQIKRLAEFVKQTGANIVLSSTWKDEWDKNPERLTTDGRYMVKKFRQVGLSILDKIDESTTGGSHRGAAINLYLEKHPEIEDYVILDDFEFDFFQYENLAEHFVQTDGRIGLTASDVEKASAVLNNEYAKDDR